MISNNKKKTICVYGCCGIVLALGLFLVVFGLLGFEAAVRALAADNVAMRNSTYGLWGMVPGDAAAFTLRNFSIYNFTNPHQFLYDFSQGKHKTPKFTELSGFLYQQKSQFLNLKYSEDQSEVEYDYWLYFGAVDGSKDVDKKYTVLNPAPLGFWMQLDSTPSSTFALQGFGGLFVEMNNTFKLLAIGQAVASVFFPTFSVFQAYSQNSAISNELSQKLWNDIRFGLNNQNNYLPWIKAAYMNDPQNIDFLYKYFFPIARNQLSGLLEDIKEMCLTINKILQNYYCESRECSSYQLTIKQLSNAEITNNPPIGQPIQSICTLNSTCIGSPEIPTFLKHQFKEKFPDEKYQLLKFSENEIAYLFTPYKNLLNIGFVQKLYDLGTSYDLKPSSDNLGKVAQLLKVNDNDKALVLWQWVKYMTNDFILKNNKGGTQKIAGMSALFAQALWISTTEFANTFLKDIYSFLTKKALGDNCEEMMMKFLSQKQTVSICQLINRDSYLSYYSLIEPCLQYSKYWSFAEKHLLSGSQIAEYCDMDGSPSNMGQILIQVALEVSQNYNCTEDPNKCTEYDLIIKQILFSEITLNPIEGYREASLIAKDWFEEIPTFEYQYYLKLAKINDTVQRSESQMRKLFTFDYLLSGPAVQELLLIRDPEVFKKKYNWENPELLRNYIRYVTIEVGFGGMTQQRSAKQLIFGYNDPFLEALKNTDTMLGGDPSIPTLIAINQPNATQEQAKLTPCRMNTGIGDHNQVRQYTSIYNKSYITYNKTWYDGEKSHWQMVSPWKQKVEIRGTDGFQTPPNIDEESIPYVYLSSIARYSGATYKRTTEKSGFTVYDFRIDKRTMQSETINPQNAKYYQTFNYLLNSSYLGLPLLISKTHLLDTNPVWRERLELVDQFGQAVRPTQLDDTQLLVQPYSGAVLYASISLQINYFFNPDILFPNYDTIQQQEPKQLIDGEPISDHMRLLPVLNTHRSGTIPEESINNYFGDLRWAINAKKGVIAMGISIMGVAILTLVGIVYRSRQLKVTKGQSLLTDEQL